CWRATGDATPNTECTHRLDVGGTRIIFQEPEDVHACEAPVKGPAVRSSAWSCSALHGASERHVTEPKGWHRGKLTVRQRGRGGKRQRASAKVGSTGATSLTERNSTFHEVDVLKIAPVHEKKKKSAPIEPSWSVELGGTQCSVDLYTSTPETKKKPVPIEPSWTVELGDLASSKSMSAVYTSTPETKKKPAPAEYTSKPETKKKPVPIEPSWTVELGDLASSKSMSAVYRSTPETKKNPVLVEPSWSVELGVEPSWSVELGVHIHTRNEEKTRTNGTELYTFTPENHKKPAPVDPSWSVELGGTRCSVILASSKSMSAAASEVNTHQYTSARKNNKKPVPIEPSCTHPHPKRRKNPHQLKQVGQLNWENWEYTFTPENKKKPVEPSWSVELGVMGENVWRTQRGSFASLPPPWSSVCRSRQLSMAGRVMRAAVGDITNDTALTPVSLLLLATMHNGIMLEPKMCGAGTGVCRITEYQSQSLPQLKWTTTTLGLKSVLSGYFLLRTTNSGSMTYSERKRVSSAKYYRNNAERVREQKRIQMAHKRAEKKAKRRQSDKPRIKSEPTTRIARMPTAGRAAPRARARAHAEAALIIPNDANATQIESRNVSEAERNASESLVLMSQLHKP
ncbi:hypothetical protein K438DRAFT_1794894, partial [Mycena galopus ATCC 62051]